MLIYDGSYTTRVQPYKSYKNEHFNKKLDKMRNLIRSIDDTSLKPEDKKRLKNEMINMLKP